ncbi:MAG: hypothetical protein CMJ13_06440 [Pelagibacterales bacterium]|nr:hypothetical protein [Pelagibacterales bacterium]
MKKLIIMVALFSLILTAVTILKHELSKLELKIQEAKDLKSKLQYDLSFLRAEWEYLASPKNIENLSNIHLNYQHTALLSFNDFLKILKNSEDLK